MNVY